MSTANEPHSAKGPAAEFLRRSLFALAVGLLGAACSVERRVEPPPLPAPLVDPIPLTVGVHYTLGFRLARPVSANRLWKIGDASVALFDTTLRSIFAEVVPVDPWPSGSGELVVEAIIVPKVVGIHVDPNQITVEYNVEVFSTQGERITGWQVLGRWRTAVGAPSRILLDEANLREAMRAAGAALIVSFYDDPHARSWLEASGVSPGKPK